MNRVQVMEKIQPVLNIKVRSVEHGARTKVILEGKDVTFRPGGGGKVLEMAKDGIAGMYRFTGLSQGLAEELSPGVAGAVATELLGNRGQYDLLLKDGRITGFTRAGERRNVPAERVLDIVERTIPEAEYGRALVDPQSLTVSLEIAGVEQKPVVRGDLVKAGALIVFSPAGIVMPTVVPFLTRLVCTNGAVGTSNLDNHRFTGGGGEGDSIWQWFRKAIKDSYRSLDRVVERWSQMAADNISPEDRALVLEALIKEAKLSGKVAEAVRARAIEEPPVNSWQAMNLITWATSHMLTEPRQVARAQIAAAQYADADTHRRICPICHTQK